MSKTLVRILFLQCQIFLAIDVCCGQGPIFSDVKDSSMYKIDYFVYAEGELENFKHDLMGEAFSSNRLKEFSKISNRKILNVVMLRVLTDKATGKIQRIVFYSIRRKDTRIISEFSLEIPSNSADIERLATTLKL